MKKKKKYTKGKKKPYYQQSKDENCEDLKYGKIGQTTGTTSSNTISNRRNITNTSTSSDVGL